LAGILIGRMKLGKNFWQRGDIDWEQWWFTCDSAGNPHISPVFFLL
jgi:hypothetical protein